VVLDHKAIRPDWKTRIEEREQRMGSGNKTGLLLRFSLLFEKMGPKQETTI
jgi:hypothetical protein